MRKNSVVLKHHPRIAAMGRDIVDAAVTEEDLSPVDFIEARNHAQQRCLPASRRSEQRKELAALNGEADVIDRAKITIAFYRILYPNRQTHNTQPFKRKTVTHCDGLGRGKYGNGGMGEMGIYLITAARHLLRNSSLKDTARWVSNGV